MKLQNKNKGFSLIELSIVLIIIGLLVAGITGGASLIKSAELRSTMSEVRNYQTAINAYYTANGSLPGVTDSAQMDFINTGKAWNDMFTEGIIDAAPTTTGVLASATTSLSIDNGMKSKVKGGFYVLGYNDGMKSNIIVLASGTTDTPTTLKAASAVATKAPVTNPSITRKDAQFLDDKMDNGIIDSGKVQSFPTGSVTTTCASYDGTATKDCALGVSFGL